jgi:hypothetical protein
MDGTNEPAKVNIGHEILNRIKSLCNGRLVIKGHGKPSGKLDNEAGEGNPPQTIEDIDMGRNVLTGNIIGKGLNFQSLIKPLIGFRVGNLLGKHERESSRYL